MDELLLERTPRGDIESLISVLRNIDCRTASLDEVFQATGKLLNYYYVMPTTLRIAGGGLWRARKGDAKKVYLNLGELWYPPPHAVATDSRMNAAGQSVFYCAPKRKIAGLEIRGHPTTDWVTVLALETRPLDLIPLGLERCEPPVLAALGYTPVRKDPRFRAFLDMKSSYLKWCMIDDYLADILSEEIASGDKYRYKRTIAVRMVLEPLDVDGFMYPSLATRRHGINLCLSPRCADEKLHTVAAHVFELQRGPSDLVPVKAHPVATATSFGPDGTIDWKHPTPSLQPIPWWDLRIHGG